MFQPDQSDRRGAILARIEQDPGIHTRALARACGMPLSTAKYHIEALRRAGRIVLKPDGRYRRAFPAGYDPAQMSVASAMHRRVAAQVLVHVASGEPWTRRSLSVATGVSGSNLGGALTHLCRAGLLARELRGGRFLYRAAGPVTTMPRESAPGHR